MLKLLTRAPEVDELTNLPQLIDAAKRRCATAVDEATALKRAAEAELDDEKAEELLRQSRAQERAARRADTEIESLLKRLAAAERRRKEQVFSAHKHALRSQAERVIEAARALSAANIAAIEAFEAARAAVGSQQTERLLPRVHFAGIALPDLVGQWVRETERALSALARAELPISPTQGSAIQRTAAEVKAILAALPPSEFRGVVTAAPAAGARPLTDGAPVSLQRVVTSNDGRVPPARSVDPPPPDDQTPLLPGEVRVRVKSGGFEGHANPVGWIKKMPLRMAEFAERNGAVEIIENGKPSDTAGPANEGGQA